MSINIRALKKSYPEFSVDIDLAIDTDQILVLAGPSGCGKTTALQMIAGLVEPDSGCVEVEGKDVTRLPSWRRGIGIVFQDLALFPHLSVGGNIGYGPLIAGASRAERSRIVEESLAAVRLSGYQKRRVDTLSGGERQRVAIARSLAASPKALLMDEPFSSLDAPLRKTLRREFRELQKRRRIPCVFVTHDREEAAAVGDRIAVMDEGRVVETGTAAELFRAPRTAFTAKFLGSGSVVPVRSFSLYEMGQTAAETALGSLKLPYALGEGCSILVPADALSILAPDAAEASVRARVAEVDYAGSVMTAELVLEENGIRIKAMIGQGKEAPKEGETVAVSVDCRRIRTVSG